MNKKEALHYALALGLGAFVLVGCSGEKKRCTRGWNGSDASFTCNDLHG